VKHLGDGRWWDAERGQWTDGRGRPLPAWSYMTVFVVALGQPGDAAPAKDHHDPMSNRPRNLKAFCQRSHMIHDRPEHQRRRSMTLRSRKAIGDLFA